MTAHRPLVLLASYPKSGNTWLRALLTNYFADSTGPAPFETFIGTPTLALSQVFEDYTGLDPALLSRAEIEPLRPAFARAYAADHTFPHFVKIHDLPAAPDGSNCYPAEAVAHVVYILRDPRDVAGAYAHHLGCDLDEAISMMLDPVADLFPEDAGFSGQLNQRLGRWDDHVAAWTSQGELPVQILRYEDLLAEPKATFTHLLADLGLSPDADKIDRAVGFSAHDVLRNMERTSVFTEKNPRASDFFNRRERGDTALGNEQRRRIEQAFGPAMTDLGYL